MILQIFYNYIVAKIDSIVNNMEDASISFVDILVKNKIIIMSDFLVNANYSNHLMIGSLL